MIANETAVPKKDPIAAVQELYSLSNLVGKKPASGFDVKLTGYFYVTNIQEGD